VTRHWRALQWPLSTVIVVAAGFLLWNQARDLSWLQLRNALAATPGTRIVLSLLATAASFACLAAYEWFAVRRVASDRVAAVQAFRIGAIAHAISNTLGFHALTGGAFRYQQYARMGLGLGEVGRVVALVAACVATGVVLACAGAFAWLQWRGAGLALLAVLAGLVAARARLALLGVVASVEMLAAVASLYVLLPTDIAPSPAQFILVVVGATVLGIASHAPGGVGVFEAAVMAALPHGRAADVLAALLAFRVIYNLLPFSLALVALGGGRALSWKGGNRASPAAVENAGAPGRGCQSADGQGGDWHR
jgi:uncharacterized membrane protein YbhN (UPF0104 family)